MGDYTVTYRAKNANGIFTDNAGCTGGAQSYSRTVKVVDTLKPVLALTYKGAVIHYGQVSGAGVNGEQNPADPGSANSGALASLASLWTSTQD